MSSHAYHFFISLRFRNFIIWSQSCLLPLAHEKRSSTGYHWKRWRSWSISSLTRFCPPYRTRSNLIVGGNMLLIIEVYAGILVKVDENRREIPKILSEFSLLIICMFHARLHTHIWWRWVLLLLWFYMFGSSASFPRALLGDDRDGSRQVGISESILTSGVNWSVETEVKDPNCRVVMEFSEKNRRKFFPFHHHHA